MPPPVQTPEKQKSRQQLWQEKQYRLKRCAVCGKDTENNSPLCPEHRQAANERLRIRRGAVRRYTTAAQWQGVDWSEPIDIIAARFGVRPSTARWRRSKSLSL